MSTYEKAAKILPADVKTLSDVGISMDDQNRAGTYILKDDQHLMTETRIDGLEVLPMITALRKYKWLREKYYYKLVKSDHNEITKYCAEQKIPFGYFIHVNKGVKITDAYQAGFCITCSQVGPGSA